MKKLYWRSSGFSRRALVAVACVALSSLAAVELMPVVRRQDRYAEKMEAARLAKTAMDAIKEEKERLGHVANPTVDPANTGMLGESFTPITSNTGYLAAKLTSTNPNFAAVMLELLDEAGVKRGDLVAVGLSGSFPGLNVSTYAALKTIGARPIVIASTAASEWGANHVDYGWLDMERTLGERDILSFRTRAASYGGIDDIGTGMTDDGRAILDATMRRNHVEHLGATSLTDSIAKRMALYDELAGGAPIKAYVNVGGGSASVGTHIGKRQFHPGLNEAVPEVPGVMDSVMVRFARRDVPVIHMSRLDILAERYGLPYAPLTPLPIGESKVFVASEYNRWLAAGSLAVLVGMLLALLRYDIGGRLLREGQREGGNAKQEMV